MQNKQVSENTRVIEVTSKGLSGGLTLAIARSMALALSFIYFVFLPRYLGAINFGKLTFSISAIGLLGILVEFGINPFVAREVARKESRAGKYLVEASLIKLFLWLVSMGALIILVRIIHLPGDTTKALYILGVGMLIMSLTTLLSAILQGFQRMGNIGIGMIIERVVVVFLGVLLLIRGYGFIAIALVMVVGLLLQLLYQGVCVVRIVRMQSAIETYDGAEAIDVKRLVKNSIPFLVILALGGIYGKIDVTMLGIMTKEAVVGWYGAAVRLYEGLSFVPQVFMVAFLPVFSKLALLRDDSLKKSAKKSFNFLVVIGIPISFGIFILADKIVSFLFKRPEFVNSIVPLKILSISLLFMYLNTLFCTLLVCVDKQKKLAISYAIAAIVNPALNLIAIPLYQHNGAAMTTLFTEFLVISMNLYFLPRALFDKSNLFVLSKAVLAGVAMVLAIFFLKGQNLLCLILLGGATYACSIYLLRTFPKKDMLMIRDAVLKPRGVFAELTEK